MKRKDRIRLDFTRNWKLPGKERLSDWLKPSNETLLSLKDSITWLGNEDIAVFTAADNFIEWSLLSTGTYEEEINKMIRISLKPGSNALDIGANIGLQSLRMAQTVGSSGFVFAFEPLNYLQEKFRRNMSLNKVTNVRLFPFALANEEAEAEFTFNKKAWNQGAFSIGQKQNGHDKQTVNIKVADQLPDIQKLTGLDLIKIDVEGFEYQVLLGLKETLRKHRPRLIFEYDERYWLTNNQRIEDCYDFLVGLQYVIYQITSIGCICIRDKSKILDGNLFCLPDDL